ncbi:MAG: ATP-dependent Clp protease ATP-binding subunit, partial [Flavobacteriaceae bacterium]|nr:ATP-dependent Clp protease ATP-binding subunit [Flavobacteriaceae bacterium]
EKYIVKYCHNLNESVEKFNSKVEGRDEEIQKLIEILSCKIKNNAILLGEAGVGKTAIVEGLAQKINKLECPIFFSGLKIFSLDLGLMVAGTKYRGQFEERFKGLIEELKQDQQCILFIDEIHSIVGTGSTEGTLDLANMIKPALARGEIKCIGATTHAEYKKYFEKDSALTRRFQTINVDEPDKEKTFEILKKAKINYEQFHGVTYDDFIIKKIITFSEKYMPYRKFPDKAFDILDEVGARMQTEVKIPEVIEDLKKKAAEIKQQKIDVVKKQNYEQAAQLRDKEKKLLDKLDSEKKKFDDEMEKQKQIVILENVYDVVSNMTKIPVSKMTIDDTKNLLNLDKELMGKVIGQDEAVKKIVKSIKRNRLGIKDPNRPIGSFIFLGSTGVGKTHLAKQLAKEIFGSEESLIRVDMSEYQEKHTVSKLVGAPP